MSDKPDKPKQMPDRFLEAPKVFIGEELVHDPAEPTKHSHKFDRALEKAKLQAINKANKRGAK